MKDSPQTARHRRYYTAFRAKVLRLAGESRLTQAATPTPNIEPKRIYQRQKQALTSVAVARGAELDPTTLPNCVSCGP